MGYYYYQLFIKSFDNTQVVNNYVRINTYSSIIPVEADFLLLLLLPHTFIEDSLYYIYKCIIVIIYCNVYYYYIQLS